MPPFDAQDGVCPHVGFSASTGMLDDCEDRELK